jgi:hypothetical protein
MVSVIEWMKAGVEENISLGCCESLNYFEEHKKRALMVSKRLAVPLQIVFERS